MTRDEASEIATMFRDTGKFSSVEMEQEGGEFALPANPWIVWLWSVNARAGNRNCHRVDDYQPNMVDAIARTALGKATKRDQAAFKRIAAEKAQDQE